MLNILLLSYFAPLIPSIINLNELHIDTTTWFIGIPALLFLIAGVKLQLKLNAYEKPLLEFVFDDKYCVQMPQDYGMLFFIGIKNSSGKDVEAEVILKEILPDTLHNISMALNPKDAPKNSPSSFHVPRSIEPTKFVEIFEWDKHTNLFHIHYYANYLAAEAVERITTRNNGEEVMLGTRRTYPCILKPDSYELALLLISKTKDGVCLKSIEKRCKIIYDKEKDIVKLQPLGVS